MSNCTLQQRDVRKRVGQVGFTVALPTLILIAAAGRFWLWAGVFAGIYVLGILINALLVMRGHKATVARRAQAEGMKTWDKWVGGTWAILYFIVTPLIAGLDVRFGWSTVGLGVHLLGVTLFAGGFALFSWAMAANAYFSTVARVQADKGQTVCSRGPYRWVRHPGYVGGVLQSLAEPLLLGSLPALVTGIIAVALMVVRTVLEDRTLHQELPGYADYARDVRYRLIPGLW